MLHVRSCVPQMKPLALPSSHAPGASGCHRPAPGFLRPLRPQSSEPHQRALIGGLAVAVLTARKLRRIQLRVASKAESSLIHELRNGNGLPELHLYCVEQDPALAADIFRDAGFVLVPGAVSEKHCHELLVACKQEEAAMMRRDPGRVGNRGRGRYSLGEAQRTGHLLHRTEWAGLIDLEKARSRS